MTEPRIDTALVRALIADQFPQWAELDVRPVAKSGWDNRTFHLGNQMTVRLPSAERYAQQAGKEHRWLTHLTPHLPLPIPEILGKGCPCTIYPFDWSVVRWLEGDTLASQPAETQQSTARDLAGFLNALRATPTKDAPIAGMHNFYRGGDLRIYDQEVRHCLAQLGTTVDSTAILKLWNRACQSTWNAPPVWVHGDIAANNLLCKDGKLSAVIDFGCCGIGDPACDLTMAWTVFDDQSRAAFQSAINLDPDTWARAAGWCAWKALLNTCKSAADGATTLEVLLRAEAIS